MEKKTGKMQNVIYGTVNIESESPVMEMFEN